jgi:hypothetical protein
MFWVSFVRILSAVLLYSFFCISSPLYSKTLIIPYPGLIEQEGLLQPSVILGKAGFSFEGVVIAKNLPSRLTIAGAFPLFDQSTLRGSGWMWAIRSGVTDFVNEENRFFAAGHYFMELGLGRGTSAPEHERSSGLRGYMEFSFRNERPKFSPAVEEVAQSLNRSIRTNKYFLSIKMGAGSAHDSQGLVQQKPGPVAFRVQSQIYLPFKNAGGSILNLTAQAYRKCFLESWLCGLDSSYQHHYEVKSNDLYEELSDLASVGAFLSYYQKEDLSFTTRIAWPYIGNRVQGGFLELPHLNFRLTKAF